MQTFLDARTSQNATYANSIAIPITAINTPELFGQIGLLTAGVEDKSAGYFVRNDKLAASAGVARNKHHNCQRDIAYGPGRLFRYFNL